MISPILLVEDSADDVELFRHVLEESGVRNGIVTLPDAETVRRYFSGQPPFSDRQQHPFPRVLVLDLKLPGQDGFEILKWARAQPNAKDLLIIVLSVSDDMRSIRRAYELGANSFLAKPLKVADVENLIQRFPQYWTRSTSEA